MSPIIIKLGKFRQRKKIASFDYDWTLVKPASGGTFPKNVDDWEWLNDSVVPALKKLYEDGYAIVIFTNQTKEWKTKQIEIAMTSINIPALIAIAMNKAEHKPARILFDTAITWEWDKRKSFFVGDALGRKGDWNNTDRLFAENIGIKVRTPEEIFPFESTMNSQFDANKKIKVKKEQEIVIMIGYPASGKSTIAHDIFEKAGYVVLSGDVLKTSAKMIKESLQPVKAGKSVVFDATNPSKKKRAEYIAFAKEHNFTLERGNIRCIHVATSMEESIARNKQRPEDKIVPRIAYNLYKKNFEDPAENEGCEVITV
jgi:bifunctional polynucleotide phosphatase/kinase